ncbi:MAG: Cdc6/Cdc18 family protein [Candidatus Methanomethylophilaceae archaeon]|jgi:cell division control protein 6
MFERASAVIRNPEKLSFGYVPEKLVHREEQMSLLERYFRPLAESGKPCYAFLTGSVGTGKTATATRFCENMSAHCARSGKPVNYVIVNCRNRNTESGILLELVRYFDKGFPDRGFSPDEMLRNLGRHIQNSSSLVVVLDEADMLLRKNGINLIYQLTRFPETPNGRGVSLILISQYPIYGMMDEASVSTFGRGNSITFNKYTRGELRSIAAARAEEALIPGRYTEEALELIADVSSEYGDARMAIEILGTAAAIAEERPEGYVTTEDVREAKANINSVVTESKISDLDINRKLALLAVARAMKSNLYISTGTAYKTYGVVCEEFNHVARKQTQFWTYIQDLDRQNLLQTVVRNDKDGGRTTHISLPDIPSRVLKNKLEEMLESYEPSSTDYAGY